VAAGASGTLARLEAPRLGIDWAGSTGPLAEGEERALLPGDAFRIASVSKTVTAVVTVKLSQKGQLSFDEPLGAQLDPALLERWRSLETLPWATPRQLLAHTSGMPNYFGEEAFFARVQENPSRPWDPVELVDHVASRSAPEFAPGEGFSYSDTGFVVAGILIEQVTGQPLHSVYREAVFSPLGMETTWLEGHEPALVTDVAHHYHGDLDMTTLSPTIDWAGGGLVTTAHDLSRFVRGLWSGLLLDSAGLEQMTDWTPSASFPSGHALRYDDYGLGLGRIVVEDVELVGHTGFIGAFAFYAPEHDAVMVGTHNQSQVDRWPLVAALCRVVTARRRS
jgi:D-alanyl-D-alanine carboxypeptidase